MNIKLPILLLALAASAVAGAASLRRLPSVVVAEGETASLDGQNAVGLQCANTAIASVTPPDGNKAILSGVRLGHTEITYLDERGPFAVRPVMVVPTYWEMLQKFFEDDPEVTIGIVGDKIVVAGQTANVDTLRKLDEARRFDADRLIVQVTYSETALSVLVKDFLDSIGQSGIDVKVLGREVCLTGRMFDRPSIVRVEERVRNFLKDFPGVSVNIDGLRIYKQKIIIDIELLSYNVKKARNLGVQTPGAVSVGLGETMTWDPTGSFAGKGVRTFSGSVGGSSDKGDSTSQAKAAINMLKQNQAAKKLYSTQLSTQSGEEAVFQSGGTIHKVMEANQNSTTTKEIEYGFIIKTTPTIIDMNTVNLEFELDHKTPRAESTTSTQDLDIERYQTRSKYVVRPGETIILSGFKQTKSDVTKSGTPLLSRIPFIGKALFGNRSGVNDDTDMLLVVTIDWALENEAPEAIRRRDELRDRSVEIEMP